MPLYWTIDSKARLFTAVAEGEVSFTDAMDLLEALAGANALSYQKMFDGRQAAPTMTPDEVLLVCAKIRAYHESGTMGPLALIGTPEQTVVFARLLGALASADRPIKVFSTPRQARSWLASLDRRDG
jgi:hypothetical protein